LIAHLAGIFIDVSVKGSIFVIEPANDKKPFEKIEPATKLIDAGIKNNG
jgi:hypothetical protein